MRTSLSFIDLNGYFGLRPDFDFIIDRVKLVAGFVQSVAEKKKPATTLSSSAGLEKSFSLCR